MGGITEMCYPANVYSRRFVPQWSMWYIQELCEYFTARKHMEEMPLYENQLLNIVSYYENYENEYGLLERLGGWNFVEWSRLNERVFDVSVAGPTPTGYQWKYKNSATGTTHNGGTEASYRVP